MKIAPTDEISSQRIDGSFLAYLAKESVWMTKNDGTDSFKYAVTKQNYKLISFFAK